MPLSTPKIISTGERTAIILGYSEDDPTRPLRDHDLDAIIINYCQPHLDVAPFLAPSLTRIDIYMGPEILHGDPHAQVLDFILTWVREHCPAVSYIQIESQGMGSRWDFSRTFINKLNPASLPRIDFSDHDLVGGYTVRFRFDPRAREGNGSMVISSVQFPLDSLTNANLADLKTLPQLKSFEVTVRPSSPVSRDSQRDAVIIKSFIPHLRDFHHLAKISFDLDFLPDIELLLVAVSMTPVKELVLTLRLSEPSESLAPRSLSRALKALTRLESITIPQNYISDRILDSLASLPHLRTLVVSEATSERGISRRYRAASAATQFPSLLYLRVSGPLMNLTSLVMACAYPGASNLQYIEATVPEVAFTPVDVLQEIRARCSSFKSFKLIKLEG